MSDDDNVHPTTRTERLRRRRRRMRWAAILVAAAIVGGAGTVAAFTVTAGTPTTASNDPGRRPLIDDDFEDEERLPELGQVSNEFVARPLSHDDPLRLWVGGDSLAGALGPALGELTAPTGIVDTNVDYMISSGLVTNVRNWPKYALQKMAEENPEVAVFMVGANDVTFVSSHDGNDDGVPDWEPEYRTKVAAMMDLLVGDDPERTVMWIGSPTMRKESSNRGAVEINRVMREEAAKRAPEVLYVDAFRLFGDENGGFTDRLQTSDGQTIRVRIDDGVHLTPAGASYLANAVFALVDARYHVNEQADPEHRIDYTVRHGTSSEGGSSGGSGNRGGRSSGSATTTTEPEPEPAPSTSSPPTTLDDGTGGDSTTTEPTPSTDQTDPPTAGGTTAPSTSAT
jgi:hypothetical protein